MDILHLETEASRLRIKLLKTIPLRNKLFLLYSFFHLLLEEKNRNIAESYLLEFGNLYFELISRIEVYGINPCLADKILDQSKQVLSVYSGDDKLFPESCISVLQQKYSNFSDVLSGSNAEEHPFVCLPLLQSESETFEEDYGVISTLNVQIKPGGTENKFHIIPGRGEPDAGLKEQANNSLVNAVRIAGKFIKIKNKFWDVYIDFENKTGEYSGSSFGVLLVLKLVEEILRFYDSPTKILSNTSAALTGAVSYDGSIPPLTKDIISLKTKIVFFSGIKKFVIPEEDFVDARNTLQEFQAEYPERRLKLVGIQSADDLFDLRNVVDIKKESTVLRTGKFIRRQALALFLLIPLIAIIIFSGIFDLDNNPDHFEYRGKVGLIVNKSGKKLYATKLSSDYNNEFGRELIVRSGKIFDTGNDGTNEIILCNDQQALKESNLLKNRIVCYNKNLDVNWTFTFDKVVRTKFDLHSDIFDENLVDTLTINDTLCLFLIARNNPNEVSAIYRLDCRTGKMLNKVLWHSGHLQAAYIYRNNGDDEFYAAGINNGLGRVALFSIKVKEMNGQLPCAPGYEFLDIETADPDQYTLLPKTDFTDYYNARFNIPQPGGISMNKDKSEILIYVLEGNIPSDAGGVVYRFTRDLRLISVSFSDDIIEKRDALIRAGAIEGPLTRTKEFEKSLISQLRYWDGKKFVTAEERFGSPQ